MPLDPDLVGTVGWRWVESLWKIVTGGRWSSFLTSSCLSGSGLDKRSQVVVVRFGSNSEAAPDRSWEES